MEIRGGNRMDGDLVSGTWERERGSAMAIGLDPLCLGFFLNVF